MMGRRELILPELGIDDVPIVVSMWLIEQGGRVAEGEPVLEVLAGGEGVYEMETPGEPQPPQVERVTDALGIHSKYWEL